MLPQESDQHRIDVDFAHRVLRLGFEFLPVPDGASDIDHSILQVKIIEVESRCLSNPHPGPGEQGKEDAVLAGCRLDDVPLLVLREVPVLRPVRFCTVRPVGVELLFNLITDRYERRATVVTTNLAFAEWVTVFAGDEKLTTALLDRLAHHATVVTTKGKSYRMRKRRGQG